MQDSGRRGVRFYYMKVGIVGMGQVGQAIARFYRKPMTADLKKCDLQQDLDIMHICIPYTEEFPKAVQEYIELFRPKVVVIHSTVRLGITHWLNEQYGNVVHSPVSGVHPNLYKGIKTFTKYIGYDNKKVGLDVYAHFKKLEMKCKLIAGSRNTEAMKLWDTTYFGWNIIFEKALHEWCGNNKVDFDKVDTEWNKDYNEGYAKLGKFNVIRPVLKHIKGKIGGHCVLPNCELLHSDIARYILQRNEDYVEKNY